MSQDSAASSARGSGKGRSVATRILWSYLVVLLAFAGASFWSVATFRATSADARLVRQGYMPLSLKIRDLVSHQDTWNSQLNHINEARNPKDKRAWFETSLAIGRPRKLTEVRAALDHALPLGRQRDNITRQELDTELRFVERLMAPDADLVARLFGALERQDQTAADRLRDELVRRGIRVQRALVKLEKRVTGHVDGLLLESHHREQLALILLVAACVFTFLIGAGMALYSRRVLAPLSLVTRRAQAVAGGELSPKTPIDSGDEIGELSSTFEGMVSAIGSARERLLASERLAAIGKMAAHVTHEVRNPLSSIALNLDLLEEDLPADREEAHALLRAIGQEVQRLTVLSDQYLSMARRKAPELEECDLGYLVRASAEFMRRDVERNQIELEVNVPAGLPWVDADADQIRQALFNLLRNAREAMPGGGHIWTSVEARGDQLVISVIDDGPGIPESDAEQLFDPFFTTKDHGTGLGLAVTRQVAMAHGGRLSYQRRPEGGSVFELSVPVLSDALLSASAEAPLARHDSEKETP